MTDAVSRWNDVLLAVVRQGGGPPGPIARGGAMMHGAIYDAVNSIVPTAEPYLVSVRCSPTASVEAAISYAAHETLATAFPSTTVDLETELDKELAMLPPSTSTTAIAAGKSVGRAAARAMIAARTGDGSDNNAPYPHGNRPGDWRPTDSLRSAATPNWPAVAPFCMTTGAQFRPPRPGGYLSKTELLRSPEYAAQFNEVEQLGAVGSASRTADQTEIALFWANDVDGTSKPPGQLFTITKTVSEQRNLDIVENARLFALVALALADAAIVAWDAKYATELDLWRPQTAIRLADVAGQGDDNPATTGDASWEPLLRDAVQGDRFSAVPGVRLRSRDLQRRPRRRHAWLLRHRQRHVHGDLGGPGAAAGGDPPLQQLHRSGP